MKVLFPQLETFNCDSLLCDAWFGGGGAATIDLLLAPGHHPSSTSLDFASNSPEEYFKMAIGIFRYQSNIVIIPPLPPLILPQIVQMNILKWQSEYLGIVYRISI